MNYFTRNPNVIKKETFIYLLIFFGGEGVRGLE